VALGAAPGNEPEHEAITVPLALDSGRPSIEIRIDGKGPYRLLFDTGSGAGLILDKQLATDLGLKSTGTRRIGDPNSPEAIEAQVMEVDRVDVGGLVLRAVDTISWDRKAMGMGDIPRGVVGLGLFGSRLVTLDYPRGTLIVEPGELPEADGRTVLTASFDDGIPSIPIDVAGVPLRAHLDSGSTGFLGVPLGTAKQLPLEAAPVEVGRGRTASGDYSVSEARLRGSVRVGGLVIERPKLHFMDLPSANLGSDLLRSLVVTVDRKNSRVRLVSSGKPLELSERPRLGIMTPGPKDGRLPIERVAPGSPAEAAGLRAGDQIVRLNGRAVAEMSASEVGDAMQARPLAIALTRDGVPVDVKLGAKDDAPPRAPATGGR
jgi:predicted aspartyl protease